MVSQTKPANAVRAYSYIRFSTPEQAHGDSLRRQLEDSIAYAAARGLILDDKLNMRDLGVSAFRGANVEKGRLGAFIKAVDSGLVPSGSFLLVESLDRLSRAEVLESLQIFTKIVNLGITIVTLMDKREYSLESLSGSGATDLIFSLLIMSRAYEESATKSIRRRKTWNQQKRLADSNGKKITKKLPFWLSLPDPSGDFVVDEEAAAVVRRVFSLSKAGLGYQKIAQMLNTDGVLSPAARTYSTSHKYKDNPRTWASSSVGYLLRNEAVIGNLVMSEVVPEKDEAPVPWRLDGYYPRIVDDETFYVVQGKRQPPRGKASALKTNLFTGLLYCGYCGGPAQVDTNTKQNYRRSRICCQRRRRGIECICKTLSYEEFEQEFFKYVSEVDLGLILKPNEMHSSLESEIDELSGRLSSVERVLARLVSAIEDDDDANLMSIKDSIRKREAEKNQIESELSAKKALAKAEQSYQMSAERDVIEIREQFAELNKLTPEEHLIMRYAIAERIASVVKAIYLYPNGEPWLLSDEGAKDFLDEGDESGWCSNALTPYFMVQFRNGWQGSVVPYLGYSNRLDLSFKL